MDEDKTSITTPAALVGCSFDAMTAAATAGKDVLLCLTHRETGKLLALQGQQGLSFNVNVETSETKTKDAGGWVSKTSGSKSWEASCDGLYSKADEGRKELVKAIVDNGLVCVGMYTRETDGSKVTYSPIRKGMAIPTSDSLDAPQDDNMTYSVSLEGTGALWMVEAATEAEIEEMTIILDSADDLPQPEIEG